MIERDYRHTTRASDSDSPEEIEGELRRNRAEMDETLDSIGSRLNPSNLAHDAWEFVREKTPSAGEAVDGLKSAGSSIVHGVAKHPLPALFIGAGLAWLIAEGVRGESVDTDDIKQGARRAKLAAKNRVRQWQRSKHDDDDSDSDSSIGDKLSSAGDRIKSGASHAVDATRDAASRTGEHINSAGHRLAESAKSTAHDVSDKAQEQFDSHPLAIALATFAGGLLAGILIPNTRMEDRAVGETAERMRERATEAADHAAAEAVRRAEEAADSRIDDTRRDSSSEPKPQSTYSSAGT